jgi:bifunctional UDP-N-acetylglucosamine pyrophosphorylase/glucosamine-1-phosphate N-acetyltransferase
MSLAIALWPGASGYESVDLLGKPVWRRTLEAARGLGAGKTFWVCENGRPAPPPGVEAVDRRELSALADTLLVLSAELPCLTASTLKGLVRSGRSRPHALSDPAGGQARAVALRASDWKSTLSGSLSFQLLLPREKSELLLVDTPARWTEAAFILRRRKVEGLLREGVLVLDPPSVFVEPEVRVGKGTKIFPWVHLQGPTVVGRDCSIGSFCHIVDSQLGAATTVLDHCFIRSSRIGKKVQIGPFAHLRPDSDVREGAKVGNFVELKKTRLGAGAKAPHLSYLGDAVIGKGANVGAGTITCNYDGVKKHRTVVGDFAFIGSDVQLLAPVRVGKGAYVAAGSCIVADVPSNALAIARSRQVVKRGWAKARTRESSTRAQRERPASAKLRRVRRSPKGGGGSEARTAMSPSGGRAQRVPERERVERRARRALNDDSRGGGAPRRSGA